MRQSSAEKAKGSSEQGSVSLLVNIPRGAVILDIGVNTLRQWISQRRIPVVKVGRLTKLWLEDIEAFINKNRREAVSHEQRGHHEAA